MKRFKALKAWRILFSVGGGESDMGKNPQLEVVHIQYSVCDITANLDPVRSYIEIIAVGIIDPESTLLSWFQVCAIHISIAAPQYLARRKVERTDRTDGFDQTGLIIPYLSKDGIIPTGGIIMTTIIENSHAG